MHANSSKRNESSTDHHASDSLTNKEHKLMQQRGLYNSVSTDSMDQTVQASPLTWSVPTGVTTGWQNTMGPGRVGSLGP
jgi:hypothetical protein